MKFISFGHDADATHKTLAPSQALAPIAPPPSKTAIAMKYATPVLAIGGASALAVAYGKSKKDPYRKPIAIGGGAGIAAAIVAHFSRKND
jgi:hypothetical protein